MTDTPEQAGPDDLAPEDTTPDDTSDDSAEAPAAPPARPRSVTRMLAYVVLPVLALLLALGAAYFKWQDSVSSRNEQARTESVQAAKDITVAMLSYQPATVDAQLAAVRDDLTGQWKQTYGSMVDSVVAPGAKEKQITAEASVAAAASVSADPDHAVVLLFVNQKVTVGSEQPGVTASSVRVTLDKVDGRWLISGYEPV